MFEKKIELGLKLYTPFLPFLIPEFILYEHFDVLHVTGQFLTSFCSLRQCFPTLFLAAHQHCVFSLSPLSNTPDSTHQLIIRWVNGLMG